MIGCGADMPISFENQCGDKLAYQTRVEAHDARMGFLKRKGKRGTRLQIYECAYCGKFHLGRPKSKRNKFT